MKIRSFLAAAIVSTAALAPFSSRADILSWTYAPSSKDDHGAKTIDGVTITPTYSWVDSTETSFAWTDSSLQIGVTGKAAYGVSYSIPASSFDGGITKVTLTAKVAKALNDASDANKSKVSVSVGGIALSPATTNLTSTATAYEFTSETTLSGEMVLSISSLLPKNNKTSYALYVQSIVVTYDDSPSGGGGDTPVGPVALNTPTDLAAYPITASGFTLSWTGDENAAGYDVEVHDANDAAAGSVSVSGTSATVTGLSSDTTYTVRVKALAAEGSKEYADSAQSEPKSVTTALAGGLVRKALFHDTFDNVPGTGWSNSGIISDTDEEGWTWSNAIRGPKGIRLGTGTNPGAATTREISIETSAYTASVTLSFRAASYTGKQTTGTVTLIDMRTNAERKILDLTPGAMTNGTSDPLAGGTEYSETITVPSSFKLRFESLSTATDHRLMLDDIVVTQVYDPNYASLLAPANVSVTDIGKTSFTVSWDEVTGAVGYEVWVNGWNAASCEAGVSSAQITELSDGVEYEVLVRARGDGLHYGDSPFSESVTATTLEDEQRIDFVVTGALDGEVKVYAGDTVTLTVSAASAATGDPAEVSFSGIAEATFDSATGAFSWTPSESDVGWHEATFTSGEYSESVLIVVASATREETIFEETFAEVVSKSWAGQGIPASGKTIDDYTDKDGWSGEHLYNRPGAIGLGNKNYSGFALSPAIDLFGGAANAAVAVSFQAVSVDEAEALDLRVEVVGASGNTIATHDYILPSRGSATDLSAADVDSEGNPLSFTVQVADAPFKLRFTPMTENNWNVAIDSIRVTQTVSAKIKTLETPEALALADGTTAGESGFTVTWTPVDGATGYDVRVLDASGATVGSVSGDVSPEGTVWTGLADDTAYTVQVRATGDTETYYPSAWSEVLPVTTARSALHPTLTLGAWQNEVGDGALYASTANSATVSATLAPGAPGSVSSIVLSGVPPAQADGATGPALSGDTLSWTPAEGDAKKTFTLAFAITVTPEDGEARTWTETVEATVTALPALEAPADLAVNAATLAWNRADFTWTKPFRAVSYTLRVWSGAADPDASGTTWSEDFNSYLGTTETQPSGWTFENGDEAYKTYDGVHVGFKASGSVTSPEISGTVNSLSFNIRSVSGTTSTLSVLGWNGTEWVELGSYTGEGLSTSTSTKTIENLAGAYSRFKWKFTKDGSNCAFGSVVLTGTGLPVAKVRTVEIASGDTTAAIVVPAAWGAVNYADITAHDAGGASQTSDAIQFSVPEQPPSVRATVFVVR